MKKALLYFPAFLLIILLLSSLSAHAAPYYWIGGTGSWSDLSHWASTSGGAGNAYGQVPQSTDNVIFDAASFTAPNQTVTLSATVTCLSMDWRGVTQPGGQLLGGGTVEIYDELHLAAGRQLPLSGRHERPRGGPAKRAGGRGTVFRQSRRRLDVH